MVLDILMIRKIVRNFEIIIKRVPDGQLLELKEKFEDFLDKVELEIERRKQNDINNKVTGEK